MEVGVVARYGAICGATGVALVVATGSHSGWVSAALVTADIAVGCVVADRLVTRLARRYRRAIGYALPLFLAALLACGGLASLAVPGLTLVQRLLVALSCSVGFLLGGPVGDGLRSVLRRKGAR